MKQASMRRSVIMLIIALVCLQSLVVGAAYYRGAVSNAYANITRMTQSILDGDVEIIDSMLARIQDQADKLSVDKNLFAAILSSNGDGRAALTEADMQDTLKYVVYTYFGDMRNLLDVNVVSDKVNYSYLEKTEYVHTTLRSSALWNGNLDQGRYRSWIPARKVGGNVHRRAVHSQSVQISELPVIRFVKVLNMSAYINGNSVVLPIQYVRPVLVVDVTTSLFDRRLAESLPTKHSEYIVIASDGTVAASSNAGWVGGEVPADYDRGCLVFSQTSRVNGWTIRIAIPNSDVTRRALESLFLVLGVLCVTTVLVILLVFVAVSKAMRPVARVVKQVESIDSALGIRQDSSKVRLSEMDLIANSIGAMNRRIDRMMRENSEILKREHEATILSLEMQINPHFLYNSLNRIYLALHNEGMERLAQSVLSLAGVLRYSVDSKAHLMYLRDDLAQLERYIAASKMGQDARFTVYTDVAPELMSAIVPKMLLQPFVENAILHGFKNRADGTIHIQGEAMERDGVRVSVFTVEDNGKGIPADRLAEITEGAEGHIGCANVHRRIRLLFGGEYGITAASDKSGTAIRIVLPYMTDSSSLLSPNLKL
jgi:two-component system sensor histidine kinase YesM